MGSAHFRGTFGQISFTDRWRYRDHDMRTNLAIWLFALSCCGTSPALHAGVTRTQSIPIRAGWNAVFLEVQPLTAKPSEVFARLPVETVSCFVPGRLSAQFLRDPGDAPWRNEGWAVWHAPSRPDAFLSNLHEIQAHRALLVLATSDFTWTVTGEVQPRSIEWHPNTCTFTGLPVDSAAPPTFAQFFEGSEAHARLRIFRLETGTWKIVRDPATTKVRSGEAYWIETDGASTYQGPLRLELSPTGVLDFDLLGGARELGLLNDGIRAAPKMQVEIVQDANPLPLRMLKRDLSKRSITSEAMSSMELPALPAGLRTSIRLEPDRDAMTTDHGDALLRITDGRGTQHWVPVRARRHGDGMAAVQP